MTKPLSSLEACDWDISFDDKDGITGTIEGSVVNRSGGDAAGGLCSNGANRLGYFLIPVGVLSTGFGIRDEGVDNGSNRGETIPVALDGKTVLVTPTPPAVGC